MIARRLDVAEQPAERQQLVVVEGLAVKHQHGVAVDRLRQLRNRSPAANVAARSTPLTSPTNMG